MYGFNERYHGCRVSFGKYKGWRLDDIPEGYLQWLTTRDLFGDDDDEPVEIDFDILQLVYRQMALKWHPDHGGSNQVMQAINDFYSKLKEAI